MAAPSPAIVWSGSALNVPATYATYQWYQNRVAIAGATGPAYTPPSAAYYGVYTVKVTTVIGNCVGTSGAYYLNKAGVAGNAGAIEGLSIYPNPVRDGRLTVQIETVRPLSAFRLILCDVTGRQMLTRSYEPKGSSFSAELDVSGVASGIYLLQVVADGKTGTSRLVVE